MSELDAILEAWRGLQGKDADAVLATVVHVTGSTYRSPGGRMLIFQDGSRIGCVSGGCLESEIVKKAWWLTQSGAPVVRVYDTAPDDDAVWRFGLGCNGAVHVMLERVNAPAGSAMLSYLAAHRAARKPTVIATVIRTEADSEIRIGDRLLLDESMAPAGSLRGSAIESQVMQNAAAALRERQSRLARIGKTAVFVEWIGPALSLVVFGAGDDAIPLVNFAGQLGWEVTVADSRRANARPDRFPGARKVVQLTADDPMRGIVVDGETAVVMMTHSYTLDLQLLPHVLSLHPRYLGILGPRKRTEKLFSDLRLTPQECVHAPAGLDAGSDRPEAIALSIAAEIQAVVNSRPGGKLKDRRKPIHTAAYEVGVPLEEQVDAAVRSVVECRLSEAAIETAPPNSALILLAAGNSTRMGTAKQLLDFEGKPMLRHAAETALSSGCDPVIVVLGANEAGIRPALAGLNVEIVVNGRWAEGMGASIQAGLRALERYDVCGTILALSDQPFVTARFLRGLVERHRESGQSIVAAQYSGTAGVPVFFAREAFPLLMALKPDQGCKGVILGHLEDSLLVDCPEAARDIDTPADYALALGNRPL